MIGVIILNYNRYKDTVQLVEALQYQTVFSEMRIVVVDNASTNDSFLHLQLLEERFNNVHVLQTGENLGYAKGNNFGLNYLERIISPKYVAILNNDVILPKDCFEKLIAAYEVLDNPCIIAPMQLNSQEEVSIMGDLNTFTDDLLNLSYVYRRIHKNKMKIVDNTGQRAMKVDMIAGSLMFSSVERFKHIGYFYPNTFLYAEERFVAYFAKKKGYNNYVLLDETYIHHHSVTIKSYYDSYHMFKMCYDSWLEYTKVCRKNGRIKALFLKPLTKLSLLEIQLINFLKRMNVINKTMQRF